MPQVFKVGSYWVCFWANENAPLEPIHVYISQGRSTEDQKNVIKNLTTRAQKGKRIDALVQGDVGCGKTIVSTLIAATLVGSG